MTKHARVSPIAWMIAPAALLFVLFFILPFGVMATLSFLSGNPVSNPNVTFTWRHYNRLFDSDLYFDAHGRDQRVEIKIAVEQAVVMTPGERDVRITHRIAGEKAQGRHHAERQDEEQNEQQRRRRDHPGDRRDARVLGHLKVLLRTSPSLLCPLPLWERATRSDRRPRMGEGSRPIP